MRRLAFVILASAATGSFAQSRAVEIETGSKIPVPKRARVPEGSENDTAAARAVMSDFARCAVDRNGRAIEKAFALPISPAYWRAMGGVATDQCLGSGKLRIPQVVMRGAIFTELYRRYNRSGVRPIAVDGVDLMRLVEKADDAAMMQQALMELAHCIVKSDLGNSISAVIAPTASSAQEVAFKALTPSLGPCLPQGVQFKFSKSVLEGVLAEVLYRGVSTPALTTEPK